MEVIMLNAIKSWIDLSLEMNPLWETISAMSKAIVPLVGKTCYVGITVLIPLRFLPNVYVTGFTIGFIFNEQVKMVVEKVNVVFNSHRTLLERVVMGSVLGFFALFTLPASFVVITLYYSAQWGASLYENSEKKLNLQKKAHSF